MDVPLVVKDLEVKPVGEEVVTSVPEEAGAPSVRSTPGTGIFALTEVFGKKAGKKQMKEKELFFYF